MIPRRSLSLYKTSLLKETLRWLFFSNKKNAQSLFLKELKAITKQNNLFLLGRGRQSLHLIFDSVEYSAGDEIITPNYYLKALLPLFKSRGLEVVLVDVDTNTLSSNLMQTIEKINDSTRFIITPHMFGFSQDTELFIEKVKEKKKDIVIIEDCAHALGESYKGRALGSFGDFAFFSFNYIKNITTLEGGCLAVNNENYLSAVKEKYQEYKALKKTQIIKRVVDYYIMLLLFRRPFIFVLKKLLYNRRFKSWAKNRQGGFLKNQAKEKLSLFLCYLGYKQLLLYKEKKKQLAVVSSYYKKYLRADIWESRVKGHSKSTPNYQLIITTKKDAREVSLQLARQGVDVGFKDEIMDICSQDDGFKNSKEFFLKAVQLPFYHSLTKKQVKKVAGAVNRLK